MSTATAATAAPMDSSTLAELAGYMAKTPEEIEEMTRRYIEADQAEEAIQRKTVLKWVYRELKPDLVDGFIYRLTGEEHTVYKQKRYTSLDVCRAAKAFLRTDPVAQVILDRLWTTIYVHRDDEEDWREDIETAAAALFPRFLEEFRARLV
jgi:hypothetical protein